MRIQMLAVSWLGIHLAILSTSADAQNLVLNGGFDNGLGGWSVGSYGFTGWTPDFGNSANGCLVFGPADTLGLPGTVYQDLPTEEGELYLIQLFVFHQLDGDDGLSIAWNFDTVYESAPIDVLTNEWEPINIIVTASADVCALDIFGFDDSEPLNIDDVLVIRVTDLDPPMLDAVKSRKVHGS